MLREIVVEQETSGDFRTTFRLCADGNVIAENVTELETQFLVSEMLVQAKAGADCVALFDTCGGEVDPATYRELVAPRHARRGRFCGPLRTCGRAQLRPHGWLFAGRRKSVFQ